VFRQTQLYRHRTDLSPIQLSPIWSVTDLTCILHNYQMLSTVSACCLHATVVPLYECVIISTDYSWSGTTSLYLL